MKRFSLLSFAFCLVAGSVVYSGELDPRQDVWIRKYQKQENIPKPENQLLNTDVEPDLNDGFVSLFNGKDLTGWTPKGGTCEFSAKDGMIVGKCVPGSNSTYLSTGNADFTDFVLTDEFSASRLLFHYLCDRVAERGESRPGLLALRNLVMLADDVDRWVLALDGSRNLALVVRAMRQEDAYRALLAMDSNITYNADLREAAERVERDLAITIDIAERTRADLTVPRRGLHVLAAECEGYTGEVAEHWQAGSYRTVFALYDRLAESVSFRRTPDCPVDLSRLAAHFGGGGHAAAAGCEYEISSDGRSQALAAMVADALDREVDK